MWSKQPKAKHLERQQQRLAERHNEHLARREDTKGSVQPTRFMTWPLGKEVQRVMGSNFFLNYEHYLRARIQEGMKDYERVMENTDKMFGKKKDISTLAGANKTEGRSPQELTETSGKKTPQTVWKPSVAVVLYIILPNWLSNMVLSLRWIT